MGQAGLVSRPPRLTPPQMYDQLYLLGNRLFGKPGRLTLGMHCALNQGNEITADTYRTECYARNWPMLQTITPDAERFEALGMLTPIPVDPSLHVYRRWMVNKHPLWAVFLPMLSMVLTSDVADLQLHSRLLRGGLFDKVPRLEPKVHPETAKATLLALERDLRRAVAAQPELEPAEVPRRRTSTVRVRDGLV